MLSFGDVHRTRAAEKMQTPTRNVSGAGCPNAALSQRQQLSAATCASITLSSAKTQEKHKTNSLCLNLPALPYVLIPERNVSFKCCPVLSRCVEPGTALSGLHCVAPVSMALWPRALQGVHNVVDHYMVYKAKA